MELTPPMVDPKRLWRPTSVARRIGVDPSMITHWMHGGVLDYVLIDGAKMIPEESVVALEDDRKEDSDGR